MNTLSVDRHGNLRDAFDDLDMVRSWVDIVGATCGLFPSRPTHDLASREEADRLIALRNAIRRLAADHTDDPRTVGQSPIRRASAARKIVNDTSAMAHVWPELGTRAGVARSRDMWAETSFTDALASLSARRTIELITSPQWDDLQPCLAPSCAYFFLRDAVRRQWCAPACGNRARVARHAQRHRADALASGA